MYQSAVDATIAAQSGISTEFAGMLVVKMAGTCGGEAALVAVKRANPDEYRHLTCDEAWTAMGADFVLPRERPESC